MDFPLIYCNGDSYSDENYHDLVKNKIYANFVANKVDGFVFNRAKSGSCNRRIIRTTLHDIIHQRQLNPKQKIIALISLSFELRSEVWVDDASDQPEVESNFKTHIFSTQLDWRENLYNGIDIDSPVIDKKISKFVDEYSRGRAFFYSPYAERINLFCDLIMLREMFEKLDIQFLIFQGPLAEKLDSDYLLDFFKAQVQNDQRFLDFENFGFCDWCHSEGFTPLDSLDRPDIGHYGPDAHEQFAEKILLPRLNIS